MKIYFLLIIYLISLNHIKGEQINELNLNSTNNLSLNNNSEIILKTSIQKEENNNFIIYNFYHENNTKIHIYISNQKQKANNKQTIYKLPLYGEKKIIIPKSYFKLENILYINISCEYNCLFEVNVYSFNLINIEEEQTISFSSYENEYIFKYEYSMNKIKNENGIRKYIYGYSTHFENFNMEILYINEDLKEEKLKETEKFIQGFFYEINKNINKICDKCYFKILIKNIKKDSFISLNIDNHYPSNNLIKPNKRYFGLLENKKKECFYFKTIDNLEYFIEFFMDNPYNSFEFENLEKKKKIIDYSKTEYFINEKEGQICLNRISDSKITKTISYQFIIYNADKMTINQPYISIIDNSFLIERKIKHRKSHIYRPSILNKRNEKMNFYIYNNNGYFLVQKFTCENFPFCIINDSSGRSLNISTINYYSFGNEFYGTIDNYNPNFFFPKTDLLIIQCITGRDFYGEEDEGKCSFNIIFYSINDIIHIIPYEKFSFLNYENKQINLTVKFYIRENNNKQIYINTYTNQGKTYPNIKNSPKDIQIFYYGNLISIEYSNENNDNIKFYEINIINNGKDLTSLLIFIGENIERTEEYFWLNQDILVTLSNKNKKKKLIIDHISLTPGGIEINDLITHFNFLNCDVNVNFNLNGSKIYKNEKMDNFLYYNIEKDFSEFYERIEFDIDLINIYQNEEICMIYFNSYLLNNFENINVIPIILNENIPSTMLFDRYTVTDITYNYIIFDYEKSIIINIEYNDFTIFHLQYELNMDYGGKKFYLYHSKKIIIYPNEIKEKCQKELLCYLFIKLSIGKTDLYENFTKKVLFTITVKTMDELPVNYLNSNTLFNDIIIGKHIQYYYSNIALNEYGTIVLNNKKGSGFLFAKIYSSSISNYIPNWQNKIYLPTKDDKQEENLIFDINKNELTFTEKHTSKCILNYKCQILIAVMSNDYIEEKDNEKSIYEYSIYLIKNKKDIQNSIVTILPNDYIHGNLNDTLYNNYYLYYKYKIPYKSKGVNFDIHCKTCILVMNINEKELPNKNKYLFKLDVIKDRPFKILFNDYEKYENKYLIIGIGCNSFDDVKFTSFSFKIYPIYEKPNKEYTLINSEHPSICFKECRFIIPIEKYDLIKKLIISVSNNKGESNKNVNINADLYNYDLYINQIFSVYVFNKDDYSPIEKFSKNDNHNYLEIKTNNFKLNNIFLEVNITIINDENNINYVYFTYSKDSQSDILFPNKKNLLYLENQKVKKLNLPYTEDKNIHKLVYNQLNTSVAIIKQVKGTGEITLNNKYKYILDITHNSFIIHYNKYSNKLNDLILTSNSDFYFYTNIYSKYAENLHEIQIGKTYYISYPVNSLPVMLYVKVPNNRNYDITFNIFVNSIKESYYEWVLKSFLSNENYIELRKKNNKIPLEYYYSINGHFDLIRNRGTGIIRGKEIKEYKTNYNKMVIFKLHEKFNKIGGNDDIIVKVLALSSHSNLVSLPQFEYFYSRIQEKDFINNKPYNIYRLEKIESSHDEMKIEFASCYGDPNFSIKYNENDLNIYQNDTFNIIEDKVEFGKRILIIKIVNIKYVYFYIFPNTKDKNFKDKEPINFTIKYYTFLRKEYKEIEILNKDIKFENINNSFFKISWSPINIKSEVNYFLKFYKRETFKNDKDINSICLKNRPVQKYHLKNNNNSIVINDFPKGEIFINLLAEFKVNSIINNIISYNSLAIGFNIETNNENNIINYIFIFIGVIFILFVIILYLYKYVRKTQFKNAYKLLGNTREKDQEEISKKLPQNYSFVIDSGFD